MNLEQIETYLAVVRTGSFHAAATARGLSQAGISQHIKKLEQRLGTTLIVRDRTGCRPAPRTELFGQYAEALLSLSRRARQALERPALVVGASSNIGIYLLQPHYKRFLDRHRTAFDLRLVIDRNAAVAEKLEIGAVDVAVMEWWDDRAGFEATRWRDEELLVIVPPGHPWCRRRAVPLEQLYTEPILGGEPGTGTGRVLAEALGRRAKPLGVAMTLGSTEAVKQAVKNGLGISLVLAGAVAEERRAGTLHALSIEGAPLTKSLYVVHRKGLLADSPAVRFAGALLGRGKPG